MQNICYSTLCSASRPRSTTPIWITLLSFAYMYINTIEQHARFTANLRMPLELVLFGVRRAHTRYPVRLAERVEAGAKDEISGGMFELKIVFTTSFAPDWNDFECDAVVVVHQDTITQIFSVLCRYACRFAAKCLSFPHIDWLWKTYNFE